MKVSTMSENKLNKKIKNYVSFSEIKQWKDCGWRHKLLYIDKLGTFEDSPHLHYGTIVHNAIENLLKDGTIDLNVVKEKIEKTWDDSGFDSDDFIILQENKATLQGWKYKHNSLKNWVDWSNACLERLPLFLEENFPGYSLFNAEEQLFEDIEFNNKKFKGFIDCILKVPTSKGDKYWIIDWKTSSGRGWTKSKQQDISFTSQLVLYKYFWSKKHNIPLNKINCGFVLLKKLKKPEKTCQLIKVSTGPKTMERSLKLMRSMLKTVAQQRYLKNKNSCMFCEFYNTIHCS